MPSSVEQNHHADHPDAVALRLEQSLDLVQTPAQIPAYARLVTHVFGEHLGQWQRGIALHNALRGAATDDDGAGRAAIARGIATLSYGSGDSSVLATLSLEDRIVVLATAASALAGLQRFLDATQTYAQALTLRGARSARRIARRAGPRRGRQQSGLGAGSQGTDRNAAETAGMVAAAEGALRYWRLAGTWLEEERAEYRLARSQELEAGDVHGAVDSAARCIRICTDNHAPPFELFFAHAAHALALHVARGEHSASAAAHVALGNNMRCSRPTSNREVQVRSRRIERKRKAPEKWIPARSP